MIYLAVIIGFVGGFSIGLFLISQILRGRSRQELVSDKSLRWKYGLIVWVMAGLGAWSAVWAYGQYLPSP
mgnify:CR=1 FL=1